MHLRIIHFVKLYKSLDLIYFFIEHIVHGLSSCVSFLSIIIKIKFFFLYFLNLRYQMAYSSLLWFSYFSQQSPTYLHICRFWKMFYLYQPQRRFQKNYEIIISKFDGYTNACISIYGFYYTYWTGSLFIPYPSVLQA